MEYHDWGAWLLDYRLSLLAELVGGSRDPRRTSGPLFGVETWADIWADWADDREDMAELVAADPPGTAWAVSAWLRELLPLYLDWLALVARLAWWSTERAKAAALLAAVPEQASRQAWAESLAAHVGR